MSDPVYSSNRKNWFHIQPRLERLSGTPLASCPVSPVDPLCPPVVLRRALSPYPGELRWATAHSTINTQAFLLSIAKPPRSSVFYPLSGLCSVVRDSNQSSCWSLLKQKRFHKLTQGSKPAPGTFTQKNRVSILGGEAAICYRTSSHCFIISRLFEDAVQCKSSADGE